MPLSRTLGMWVQVELPWTHMAFVTELPRAELNQEVLLHQAGGSFCYVFSSSQLPSQPAEDFSTSLIARGHEHHTLIINNMNG